MTAGVMARRVFYGEHPPSEPLAEHVLSIWSFDVQLPEGEVALHSIWPDGCVSLSVVGNNGMPVAASIIGPRLRALRIPMRRGLTVRAIRLWPDTAAQLLGVDPVAVRDLMRPAADLLGVGALMLARTVASAKDDDAARVAWERWLAPRIETAGLPDPDIRLVVRLLIDSDGAHNLTDAASRVGLRPRQLERRFSAAVGLTPRQFAKVRRVRAAISAILEGERQTVHLAQLLGFEDQTQFAREFRSVTGLAPQQLIEQLDQLEHGDASLPRPEAGDRVSGKVGQH